MTIVMTCSCGQRLSVASTMAGQKLACVRCGELLTVPAMGVLIPSRAKPRPIPAAPAAVPSQKVAATLMAAGIVLMLLGLAGWMAWTLTRETAAGPQPLAQAKEIVPGPAPAPSERKPAEPAQSLPASLPILQPVVPEPAPKMVEPTPPDTAPRLPPLQPKETPPLRPDAEPVRPVVDEPVPKGVAKETPRVMEPLKLVWKLKEGETIYQEVIVTQKPNFRVQGVAVASLLQYRIVSRFTIQKANEDGSLVVQQRVESAKLLQADTLTQAAVAGAVAQLPGTTYTLQLSPRMEVTQLQAAAAGLQEGVVPLGGGQGMQMASLLDRDGWKELAQITFFQRDQPLPIALRWSKPLTHHWGALGTWAGQSHYQYQGAQGAIHQVAYRLQLNYKPPAKGAMVAGMQVNSANLQTPEASGVILFDPARGRVVQAEERFRVKGVLNAQLLGQNTAVEIDEDQYFLIRIHASHPPDAR